jgi:threonine dehydrogenase-like Zn-dependent dehydrogenase
MPHNRPHQAFKLADGISDTEGAMAEPLAVALHAANRAGALLGRPVLVTGCGPIGALVIIAARRAGATRIIATDVVEQPLRKAAKVGADETINVAAQPDALSRHAVSLINQRLVDCRPLMSAALPYRDAGRAFALAADRTQSMKVLLDFD